MVKDWHISENKIDDQGLLALATPLRRHPTLTKLYLYNNHIGDKGLAALVAPAEAAEETTKALAKLEMLAIDGSISSHSLPSDLCTRASAEP